MNDKQPKISYEDFHKKCRDFLLYFEGYVKSANTPMFRLIKLFSDIEEIVFGEIKTKTWAY